MDSFKLLTSGAKFNPNKFKNDFKRFNKTKRICEDEVEEKVENLKRPKNRFNVDECRIENGIIVDGIDIKPPLKSFDELNLNECLKANMEKSNYLKPTPIQMQVIPLLLDQRQVIACAPTGSGKTLAFLLPILIQLDKPQCSGFRAIILAPTRELAKQIHRESLWISDGTGLRVHLIKNINLAAKMFNENSKLKYDILITTPKRLEYLLKKNLINIKSLEWLIVDECDRLFQGTFLQQLSSIFNSCFESSSSLKLSMFSATYDPDLHEWCKLNLNNIATVMIGEQNKVVDTIDQKLVFTGSEAGKLFALKEIINNGCKPPVLIFVNTMRKSNFLQRQLDSMGVSVDAIHSGRNQEYRDKIVRSFREGKILFLICTELMGRGIDFKAVNLVINYDLPSSSIAYIHHIGRTGRAGRTGTAITLYSLKDEESRLLPILNVMRQSGCDIPSHLQTFDKNKMLSFRKLNNRKDQSKKQRGRRKGQPHKKHLPVKKAQNKNENKKIRKSNNQQK